MAKEFYNLLLFCLKLDSPEIAVSVVLPVRISDWIIVGAFDGYQRRNNRRTGIFDGRNDLNHSTNRAELSQLNDADR